MTEIMTEMATTVLLGVLSLAGAFLTMYIKKAKAKAEAEIEKIEDEKKKELLKSALSVVDKLASRTVTATEQTVAKELREAVKDGYATKEELCYLGKDAITTVYAQLKQEYIDALEENITDVEQYISDVVETKVLAMKTATKE